MIVLFLRWNMLVAWRVSLCRFNHAFLQASGKAPKKKFSSFPGNDKNQFGTILPHFPHQEHQLSGSGEWQIYHMAARVTINSLYWG